MRLLYAIDIRDEQLWHLDQVESWARKLGGTVDLLYVNPFGDYAPYTIDPTLTRVLHLEMEKARAADERGLHRALERLPPDLRGTTRVVAGDPAPAIAEAAADYDVLLVSTRGRTGLARMWLGSVAERLLRLRHGSTVVLHPKG